MPIIPITNFGGGVAEDYINGNLGEFSISKHFDILTFPNRLQPLRGMEAESTTDSKIAKIIISPSNGLAYGVGTRADAPTLGKLWYKADYTASWTALPTDQISSGVLRSGDEAFLVYYGDETGTRKMFWATTNLIMVSDPAGGSSSDSGALTFSTISNGYVHPTTKRLYFAYTTSTNCYVAQHDGTVGGAVSPSGTLNATSGVWNTTALTLPSQYRVYAITSFGDYLAIGATTLITGGDVNSSVVFLWDMKSASWNETINWGEGTLKVLNNLDGYLVGVSQLSSLNVSGIRQDTDKIVIKMYGGGSVPQTIKEIVASRLTTSVPSCQINPNVNFVYENKLYFSADVVNGDADANYYGLWCFGKNKNGNYVTTIERGATIDNSETSILAAAIAGDNVLMAHTATGTLVKCVNSNALDSIYTNTSIFESVINPSMTEEDKRKRKKLVGVYVNYLPLPTDAQVVMKYRVDKTKDESWTTIFTETTDDATRTEFLSAGGTQFTEGTNYEFRLESIDGAIITGYGYKYDVLNSQI